MKITGLNSSKQNKSTKHTERPSPRDGLSTLRGQDCSIGTSTNETRMAEIVNKIASSGLETLDPADFLPQDEEIMIFDLKPFLFRELILKEKDFREMLKDHDWEQYRGKVVALGCSVEAIIPMWAYMLVTSYLEDTAGDVVFGSLEQARAEVALTRIGRLDQEGFRGRRVVIKGCGERVVPTEVYVRLMKRLKPVARSVMFGEPCSTVPVYKQRPA